MRKNTGRKALGKVVPGLRGTHLVLRTDLTVREGKKKKTMPVHIETGYEVFSADEPTLAWYGQHVADMFAKRNWKLGK